MEQDKGMENEVSDFEQQEGGLQQWHVDEQFQEQVQGRIKGVEGQMKHIVLPDFLPPIFSKRKTWMNMSTQDAF